MTAAEKLLQKSLAASHINSAEWSLVASGLRDRAFFSAKVEETRLLHTMRQEVAAIADGTRSPSEVRRDLRAFMLRHGINPQKGTTTLEDLSSRRRLDTIIDINVRQARGYIQHLEATTPGALHAFPCQELIRTRQRDNPRDWEKRWKNAGGTLHAGRMIALKTDPIWRKINRFGNDYPPFDFNSGMGVRDINRKEALRLGIIQETQTITPPPRQNFNQNLKATVPYSGQSEEYQYLKDAFGDQITHKNNEIIWQADLIKDAFRQGNGTFSFKLGKASKQIQSKMPNWKGKPLQVSDKWLFRKDGHGLKHFKGYDTDERNIPLTEGDFDLMPTIWRNPDEISSGGTDNSIKLKLHASDGDLVMIVRRDKAKDFLKMATLYKNKVLG